MSFWIRIASNCRRVGYASPKWFKFCTAAPHSPCVTWLLSITHPHKHHEAITSRPLLLHGVATKTQHGGQTTLTITSQHAKQAAIQAVLTRMAAFLSSLKSTAEQLTDLERLTLILRRAFAKFLQGRTYPAALLAPG